MNEPSRRGFLAIAGASAATIGVASVATAADAKPAVAPSGHTDPLVAYVRDAHTGEVAVLVGEREVVVHDHDLAARIARVASSKG